jgi:hypothetical protein
MPRIAEWRHIRPEVDDKTSAGSILKSGASIMRSSLFSPRQKDHIVTLRKINIFNQEASNDGDIAPQAPEAGNSAGFPSRAALRHIRRPDSLRAAKRIRANRPKAFSGFALPQHRPASRRARDGGGRASQAAKHVLYGRDRRRRLEDNRCRA